MGSLGPARSLRAGKMERTKGSGFLLDGHYRALVWMDDRVAATACHGTTRAR